MDILLILPNQLFDIKYFPKNIKEVVLWEHKQYFTAYKYNKLKLILHRSSMKCYDYYLKENGYKTKYVNFYENYKLSNELMFSTADNIKVSKNIIDNPNFLISNILQNKYAKKTDKFIFNNFYMFFKKELDILPNIKSMDKFNRKSIPIKELNDIPKPYNIKFSDNEKKIIKDAINYIKNHFNANPGPDWKDLTDKDIRWNYPITIKQAKLLWKYFIQNKLNKFADYQDYIYFDDSDKAQQIYHSCISSSLNIGFLNPKELINELLKSKNIRAKEAFIRQLFWREYQLYCYRYCNDLFKKALYFKGNKKLGKYWYSIVGEHNIKPISHCIKKAWQTGYLHHIERLMIVGNFMLLSGINPEEGFKWFMEFSIDAYEWVMYQNVYDMVFYKTGGKTTTRPYISSSNYIIKMSNITKAKANDWSYIWDELYHNFLKKNKNRIGYPYEI
jgi:deoxyribodipyrimidine photolyase-related protein